MKRILFSILCITAVGTVSAQQLQTSAFNELQAIIHNPSFAGMSEHNFVGINYRAQWTALEGAPKTATVFGSFALPKQKMGIGGYLFSDKTGVTTRTGVSISVAKHIVFSDQSKLSLAIENRFQQTSFNQAKLAQTLGNDPAIANAGNTFNYDAGFGATYTNNRLQLGISAAQLLQSKINNYSGTLVRSQEARLYRHFYMNGSYKIDLDETFTLTPNFLLIYLPNAPFEYCIGARLKYKDQFTFGAGMNASKNVNFSLGVGLMKNLAFDYAFDIYNNPFDNVDQYVTTHEFMLRYSFNKK